MSRGGRVFACLPRGLLNQRMTKQEKIEFFTNEILSWNRKINLTGLKDPDSVQRVLINESLYALDFIMEDEEVRAIDLGTGCGIPGIPIKIWRPLMRLDLVERNRKKATFVRKIVRDLNLENSQVFNRDYRELLHQKEFQFIYDFILVRGLGLSVKARKQVNGFLKKTGQILIWEIDNKTVRVKVYPRSPE